MINLKINGNREELFLRIEKNNCVLVENEIGVMKLYLCFYKIICEKNNELSGYFDYKAISSKDFVLFNLLNYSTYSDSFQFKKGSLLFYYIELLLKSSVDDADVSIYDKISTFLDQALFNEEVAIDYQIDEDFMKLVLSICNFSVGYNGNPLVIMKKMLHKLLSQEMGKKYIIFYNSRVLDFDFSQYDCCYSFDINFGYPLKDYNLISFSDRIQELNLEVLEREIKLLWPISYEEDQIVKSLKKYFGQYLFLDELYLTSTDEVIMAHIIQKLFHFNKNLIYDNSLLNNNIKSFLTNF